jgi:hypothetical protein
MAIKATKGKGRPAKGYFTKDGKRVPSNTTILGNWVPGKNGLLRWAHGKGEAGVPFDEMSRAALNAGTIAHDLVECHLRKVQPKAYDAPPEIMRAAQNGLEAFLEWNEGVGLSAVETEVPIVYEGPACPPYGTTIDCVALTRKGDFALADWKLASGSYSSHFYQIGGCVQAWEYTRPDTISRFFSLRFGKGDPEVGDPGGDFHHKSITREQCEIAIRGFNHLRETYEIEKAVKRWAK